MPRPQLRLRSGSACSSAPTPQAFLRLSFRFLSKPHTALSPHLIVQSADSTAQFPDQAPLFRSELLSASVPRSALLRQPPLWSSPTALSHYRSVPARFPVSALHPPALPPLPLSRFPASSVHLLLRLPPPQFSRSPHRQFPYTGLFVSAP